MRRNTIQFPELHSPARFLDRTAAISSLRLAAFSCIIALALCTSAAAADFSGSLNGVTITDATGVNIPPNAFFTYTQDGKTISFNASGSTDSDGTITRYKWDFGNGTTSEGPTAIYTLTDTASLLVTLTVTDNNNGVSLSQQTTVPKGFTDDFSSDSSTNYSSISGSMSVSNGTAHGKEWATSRVYCNSPLQSDNHFAEADVVYSGGSDSAGVLARVEPANQTGYVAYFSAGKIHLARFKGSSQTWLSLSNEIFIAGTYTTRLEVSGNNINVYVNGALKITKADNSYTIGKNVGFYLNRSSSNTDITVDNFKAETL